MRDSAIERKHPKSPLASYDKDNRAQCKGNTMYAPLARCRQWTSSLRTTSSGTENSFDAADWMAALVLLARSFPRASVTADRHIPAADPPLDDRQLMGLSGRSRRRAPGHPMTEKVDREEPAHTVRCIEKHTPPGKGVYFRNGSLPDAPERALWRFRAAAREEYAGTVPGTQPARHP